MRRNRLTYQPGHSTLHRLHPLTKVVWLVMGTVLVFLTRSPWLVMAVAGLLVGLFVIAGVRFQSLMGTRVFVTTALMLALLQMLFVREGAVVFSSPWLTLTTGGFHAAVYVGGRFMTVILLSYLFVTTTEPNDLAYALMRAGIPYRFGFAAITALRLVPVFEQEGQTVYNAQLARGVRYDTRGIRRSLTLARLFLLPLLVSALGKVDALAVSMDGRCFGKYPTRTFLRQVHFTWLDGAAFVLLILTAIAVSLPAFL
ncbi:MAG: energy-coupling factor transporter transmembrane component T [Anaerolineae bacterium]|nr:energy-coupling factor transporter transmembrane component T [Anaerolineae bacterium]